MYLIKKTNPGSAHHVLVTDGFSQILEIEDGDIAEATAERLRHENPNATYEVVPVGSSQK
jgi:hypothetical protein